MADSMVDRGAVNYLDAVEPALARERGTAHGRAPCPSSSIIGGDEQIDTGLAPKSAVAQFHLGAARRRLLRAEEVELPVFVVVLTPELVALRLRGGVDL